MMVNSVLLSFLFLTLASNTNYGCFDLDNTFYKHLHLLTEIYTKIFFYTILQQQGNQPNANCQLKNVFALALPMNACTSHE